MRGGGYWLGCFCKERTERLLNCLYSLLHRTFDLGLEARVLLVCVALLVLLEVLPTARSYDYIAIASRAINSAVVGVYSGVVVLDNCQRVRESEMSTLTPSSLEELTSTAMRELKEQWKG